MSEHITPQILDDYRNNGVVCIRNVFNQYWIDKVAQGIEYNLKNPSIYSEKLSNDGESGAYFNDYCNWNSIEELKEYIYKSPAAQISGILMDSERSVFYHEHVLVKDPGTTTETPWHQDQAYYPIDGFKVCSIWMPIDSVSLETTIQFAASSHLNDKWFIPRKFATKLNYHIENDDEKSRHYLDVPHNDEIYKTYKILKFDVQPGDCIVFHMRTLHGAPGNTSQSIPRRILSTRWLGDDAVIATRPWKTSPPTTGGLKVGQNVNASNQFPLIWSRNKRE